MNKEQAITSAVEYLQETLSGEQIAKATRALKVDNMNEQQAFELVESMKGIENIIQMCGDNVHRNGLQETPFRVAKAFLEYTEGYREDPTRHLTKSFDVFHDGPVIVKNIRFNSMCEHHFAPFFGEAHIAYIPREGAVTGLSKFARLVDGFAKRFQVQERLTQEIAGAIQQVLDPIGLVVLIEAKHYCMCGRGVVKPDAVTLTSTYRGSLTEVQERTEVMNMILK